MAVCPVCNNAYLKQQRSDKRLFVCSDSKCPIRYFTLLNRKDLKDKEVAEWEKLLSISVQNTENKS